MTQEDINKKRQNLIERTVDTRQIYSGRVIDLQLQQVILPNGKQASREVVNHPGAVAIIAKRGDNILFVEQYRQALHRITLEIPAGKLISGEDPSACAERELREETGCSCGNLKRLFGFYTSPGFSDEFVHLFLAEDLHDGVQNCDDDEFINVMEISVNEGWEMVQSGKIEDGKTIVALLYLMSVHEP